MRKALIFALLAAGVSAPTVASAQDEDRGRFRAERQDARESRGERQEARQERRAERQQARQERQQAEPQPQRQERQERREQRVQNVQPSAPSPSTWVGNPNDPRMEAHRRRYERLDRERARDFGTREQYQSVVAQQRGERANRRDDRQDTREDRRDDRRDVRSDRRDDRRDTRDDRRDNRQEWRGDRRDNRQDWRDDRRDNRQEWRGDRRDDRQDWRRDRRDNRRDWNSSWRNDRRYDWQRHRNYNRSIFRGPSYYAPYRGYSYRRFTIGSILNNLFFGQNYWINDPFYYRLPPAPYGTRWVRYYNDVVLVDTYTGEVVDVIHDFFW